MLKGQMTFELLTSVMIIISILSILSAAFVYVSYSVHDLNKTDKVIEPVLDEGRYYTGLNITTKSCWRWPRWSCL